MNLIQIAIGAAITIIFLAAINIGGKKKVVVKKEITKAPEQKKQETRQRPKNYSELIGTIAEEKKKQGDYDVKSARQFFTEPREFNQTVDMEHLEAENVYAVDEDGSPTKRNVSTDEIDIPILLSQYKDIVAIANIIGGVFLALVLVGG